MPRLDVTRALRDRFTPNEQLLVGLLTELVNELRLELGIPPVTADILETRLRDLVWRVRDAKRG